MHGLVDMTAGSMGAYSGVADWEVFPRGKDPPFPLYTRTELQVFHMLSHSRNRAFCRLDIFEDKRVHAIGCFI